MKMPARLAEIQRSAALTRVFINNTRPHQLGKVSFVEITAVTFKKKTVNANKVEGHCLMINPTHGNIRGVIHYFEESILTRV